MKLSIIIVNYQSYKNLLLCLKSINAFLYENSSLKNNFEVILVNNDTEKLSLPVKYPFLNKKIIEVGKNVGFGVAANLGTIMTAGEYILFVNPDVLFTNSHISKALNYLEKHPSVGALGLSITDCHRRSPENWSCGKKITWGDILFRNTINKPWNKKQSQEVDWSSGAGLIVRKNIFREVKGFDKNFFMYFEDQDLCLRIKSLPSKPRIIHYPASTILHLNGKSWNNKRSQKKAYGASQVYFFKKHNSFVGYLILKMLYKIKNLFK